MHDDDLPVLSEVVREGDESVIRSTRFGHVVATAGGSVVRAPSAGTAPPGHPLVDPPTASGSAEPLGAIGIDASVDVDGGRASRFLGDLIDLRGRDEGGDCAAVIGPDARDPDDAFDDTLALGGGGPREALDEGGSREASAEAGADPRSSGHGGDALEARVEALIERHVDALRRELRTLLAERRHAARD